MKNMQRLYNNFLSVAKTDSTFQKPESGSVSNVQVSIRDGDAQVVSTVSLGKTVATSRDYEFARFNISVSLVGDQSCSSEHDEWCRTVVVELLAREEESLFSSGREVVAVPPVPNSVSYGELRICYGRTVKGKKKHSENTEMLKVDVEQGMFFKPSLSEFLDTYQALEESLTGQYEKSLASLTST